MEVNSVLADSPPCYKNFQDAIEESSKLLRILSNIISECATCSDKLKSQLNESAGVTSPSKLHGNTTTQTRKLNHFGYRGRRK
jgi:hypothetical protein